MFDPKSDYALNKLDPEAIVCPSVTGIHIRLTREDFASEEEFLFWKELSDGDYHSTEKAEHIHADHSRPLDALSGLTTVSPSVESVLVSQQEQREREQLRRLLLQGMDIRLSPTQRRRLWLYYVDGLTEEAIASVENVKQQSVSECLQRAKEKMKNFLKSPL